METPLFPSLSRTRLIRLVGAFAAFCAAVALHAQTPPAVYDLRTAGPGGVSYVAAIQDQGQLGDCWSFASITAMDSSLIQNGYFTTSTTPPPMQLSMWHLAATNGDPEWLTNNVVNGGADYQQPVTGNYNWGGEFWMATGYVTRGAGVWETVGAIPGSTTIEMGGGPVYIASNPLNAYPLATINAHANLSATLPPADQGTPFYARSVSYYDQSITNRSAADQIAAVKTAMINNGALTTAMYAAGGFTNGTASTPTTYFYNGTAAADHAVTLIGWDDAFQVPGAPGVGAWLIQNSWGTSWTPDGSGVFYAAYDSVYVAQLGVTGFELHPATGTPAAMLQNQFGPVGQTGNGNTVTGLTILDASATGGMNLGAAVFNTSQSTLLSGIGLVSPLPDTTATVSFFAAWGEFGPTGGLPGLTLNVSFDEAGYALFDLDTPYYLAAGDELVVQVDFNGTASLLAYDSLQTDGATISGTGLSYYYNGTGWEDFASLGSNPGVFVVKGYTLVPEPGTYALFAGMLTVMAVLVARRHGRKLD